MSESGYRSTSPRGKCPVMAISPFLITEHVICQHIREYPRATRAEMMF